MTPPKPSVRHAIIAIATQIYIGAMCFFIPSIINLFSISFLFGFQIIIGFLVFFIASYWAFAAYYVALAILLFYDKITRIPRTEKGYSPSFDTSDAGIAILYMTSNDFDAKSVESILNQTYDNTKLYICDDSTDGTYQKLIDDFVSEHTNITHIRREERTGYKAGNINNAINYVNEKFCIICDSDQILPATFTSDMVQLFLSHGTDNVAYIQASHKIRIDNGTFLQRTLGSGIELFWDYIVYARYKYGFSMFYGHGGIFQTEIVKTVKFPEIVAEDLAFSIVVQELGYKGIFTRDVYSYESFPDQVSVFRKRHMKWVRGSCEFLKDFSWVTLKSKSLSISEKVDVMFSVGQVPLGGIFVLFVIITSSLLFHFSFFSSGEVFISHCGSVSFFDCFNTPTKYLGLFFSLAPFYPFLVLVLTKPVLLFLLFFLGIAFYVSSLAITFWATLGFLIDGKADFLTSGDSTLQKKKLGLFRNPANKDIVAGEILLGLILSTFGLLTDSFGAAALGLGFLNFTLILRTRGLTVWTLGVSSIPGIVASLALLTIVL